MKKIILISLAFLFIFAFGLAWADEAVEPKPKAIQAVEFLSGYGWGHLRGQEHYKSIPFIVDIDYDFKAITKKIGFNPSSLVQFQLEPFANWIYNPHDNVEMGLGFMFKFGLVPETWKFQPYLKAGSAPSYISLNMREEANGFNFISSACAGFHYSLTQKTALTAEYRYRHLSNAGTASPNSGVNTQVLLAGMMYSF